MAAITGAVIAAGTAIAGSVASSKAAKRATRAQTTAADRSLAEQRRQFELTRGDFAGTRERGGLAGEERAALLGLRGGEAEQEALGRFQESPGQAFLRERQERALLRNEAAIGGLGGGNVRTALQEQAFGIASTQLGERLDRLGQVAELGVGATTSGAAIGSGISRGISGTLERRGDVAAGGIRESDAIRQSGLRRIAGAFTGSGGILDVLKKPTVFSPAPVTARGGPI